MTRKRLTLEENNLRINLIITVFVLTAFAFIARLFQIQVLNHGQYEAMAQEQYWELQEIPARRGDILSSDGYPLATTQVSYFVYAEPKVITDKLGTAKKLAEFFGALNKYGLADPVTFYEEKFYNSLSLDLFWVKLHSELTPEEKHNLEKLQLEGIGFEEEPKRYYPENTLASHVLGFVARNEKGEHQGYFGIEGSFNGDLRGRPGRIIEEQDALGAPILVGGYKRVDPINGRDIVLTINRAVQYIVENRLKEGVLKYGALSGSVIVMDPFTGDVVAMANYPTFDPANFNDFGTGETNSDKETIETAQSEPDTPENTEADKTAEADKTKEMPDANPDMKKVERRNLAIQETYEPGSVMKPLTVSAAIDLGIVEPTTTFVDAGPVQYSDYVIDNWDGKHHGTLTIIQLLQKSNNIGAAWVGHQVGAEKLSDYQKNFGLGEPLGIDLEGEDTGIVRDPDTLTAIDLATVSFGQGISATPLQMLNVINVMANGGNLIKPRIVEKLIDNNKELPIPVKNVRRVLSEETAGTMVDLLTQAVEGGESRYFNIKGYKVAGKTGTAQIPVNGKYDPKKTNATFVGFLPESKKYTMIVKLQEPTSSVYAAETAVPLWMQITEDLVKFYGIPVDKKEELVEIAPTEEPQESTQPVVQDASTDTSGEGESDEETTE